MSLRRVGAMVRKEFRHMLRDPRTILISLIQPVVFVWIFGYLLSLDVREIRTAWLDRDRSPQSRELQQTMVGSTYFRVVAHAADEREARRLLDAGDVKLVVVVPDGFGDALDSGNRTAPLQVLLDGSDNTMANTASGYLAGLLADFEQRIIRDRLGQRGISTKRPQPRIDAEIRVWYNPRLDSTPFIVSGLIAVILMYQTSLLPAVSIVRERENRTIDHLLLSPLTSVELVLAKIVPYVVLAMFNLNMVIGLGMAVFDLPMRGSYLLLVALSAVFIAVPVGLGVWVSTVAESQATAMLMAFLMSNLPAFLLSGFIFPIESMPGWLQILTLGIPPRHFLVIIRGITIKGLGFADLWWETLLLALMGLLLLAAAAVRFQRLYRR